MTSYNDPFPSGSSAPMETSEAGTSTTDTAKEQASQVGQEAAGAAKGVSSTAVQEAKAVSADAAQQARELVTQAKTQAEGQAVTQRDRIVEAVRSLSAELSQLADNSGQSGMATQFARQAADRSGQLATYLEQRQPSDLLEEARGAARQRPAAFLTGAGVAGFIAGRIVRGAASGSRQLGPAQPAPVTVPAVDVEPTVLTSVEVDEVPVQPVYDDLSDPMPVATEYETTRYETSQVETSRVEPADLTTDPDLLPPGEDRDRTYGSYGPSSRTGDL